MSEIFFQCPVCGQNIQGDDNLLGQNFNCPYCSSLIKLQQNDSGFTACKANAASAATPTPVMPVIPTTPAISAPVSAGSGIAFPKSVSVSMIFASIVSVLILAAIVTFIFLNYDQGKKINSTIDEHSKKLEQIENAVKKLEEIQKHPNYEYKVLTIDGGSSYISDRNRRALSEDEIQKRLSRYPQWELVDVITEIETVHPNFGNSNYVAGLQPNTRTWCVRLIIRRKK